MNKYVKKPVVIEAVQCTEVTHIETLEGTMRADVGDWIITGIKGERYPCKPDIFEATYAPYDGSTDQLATLRAEVERLRAALREARASVEKWASYADEYYKQKWDLAADLKEIDNALQGGDHE